MLAPRKFKAKTESTWFFPIKSLSSNKRWCTQCLFIISVEACRLFIYLEKIKSLKFITYVRVQSLRYLQNYTEPKVRIISPQEDQFRVSNTFKMQLGKMIMLLFNHVPILVLTPFFLDYIFYKVDACCLSNMKSNKIPLLPLFLCENFSSSCW